MAFAISVLIVIGTPATASAASPSDTTVLAPGLRVRIGALDVAPGKTVGIVGHIDAQSVVVSVPERDKVFPLDEIMALDIRAIDSAYWRGSTASVELWY